MSCFFSASLKWRKFFLTPSASPRCRKIASSNVSDCPSCINRLRVRTPPEGRCPHAVGGDIERRLHLPVRSPEVLFDRNDDAVASAHIMQKEITEWMELFSAKRVRHGECAPIDGRPGRSRFECPNVAGCTPDLIEQDRALLSGA